MEGEPDDEGLAQTAGVGTAAEPAPSLPPPPTPVSPGAPAPDPPAPEHAPDAGPIVANGVVGDGGVWESESPWSSRWLLRWWRCR